MPHSLRITAVVMVLLVAACDRESSALPHEDPFALWEDCPRDSAAMRERLADFEKSGEQFVSLDDSTLDDLAWGGGWRAAYLGFVAPYLLGSTLKAEVAKSCWLFYEETIRALRGVPLDIGTDALGAADTWESCLRVSWREEYENRVTPYVGKLMACLKQHAAQVVDKR